MRVWSRLGNEKTRQFSEVADAVQRWARNLDRPVILGGEIVTLDQRGAPTGFQNLQGRMRAKAPRPDAPSSAFIAFDLLRNGDEDLRPRPLRERRRRLEALFDGPRDATLRLSEQSAGDGRASRCTRPRVGLGRTHPQASRFDLQVRPPIARLA